MRTFMLLAEGQPAKSIYVRSDGEVTVFEGIRKIRCWIPMQIDDDTDWHLLSRVVGAIVQAEEVRLKIDRLVERVQTGWQPVAAEIDPDIPQRKLTRAHLAIDAIAFPDDPEFYSPPTRILGLDERGHVQPTGEILWIDSQRQWAVCDDGFWWTA